jgi:hypothetical protein
MESWQAAAAISNLRTRIPFPANRISDEVTADWSLPDLIFSLFHLLCSMGKIIMAFEYGKVIFASLLLG